MNNPYDLSNRVDVDNPEICTRCDNPTDLQKGDPFALYIQDFGPLCDCCHDAIICDTCNGKGKIDLLLDATGIPNYLTGFPNGQVVDCQNCNGLGFRDE